MINAEQIRMARAILDWSTIDLSRVSGITSNAINKIERGKVAPHAETINALQSAFEDSGLEFLPFSGVRKRDNVVQVWDDAGAYERLLGDIFREMRDTGGEVLISGLDETHSTSKLGRERVKQHVDALRRNGVSERLLMVAGDKNFVGPVSTYRWVPEKYFSPDSILIYGGKLALAVWDNDQKVIVINDPRMVESMKKLFEFVWDHSEQPKLD